MANIVATTAAKIVLPKLINLLETKGGEILKTSINKILSENKDNLKKMINKYNNKEQIITDITNQIINDFVKGLKMDSFTIIKRILYEHIKLIVKFLSKKIDTYLENLNINFNKLSDEEKDKLVNELIKHISDSSGELFKEVTQKLKGKLKEKYEADDDIDYYSKYMKYKHKYLELKALKEKQLK